MECSYCGEKLKLEEVWDLMYCAPDYKGSTLFVINRHLCPRKES